MDHLERTQQQQQQQQQQKQQQQQQQQPVVGIASGSDQMSYAPPSYQTAPIVASGNAAVAMPSPTQPPQGFSSSPHQITYQQAQHFQSQQQQLQVFWGNQMHDIEQTTDFKNHSLPLARIKKIMKADGDVRMISAEAPVIFAKACEIFILELTLRSWIHTEENKRRTLQKNDLAAAISRTDVLDFLVDIIPRDELKEEGLGMTKAIIPVMGSAASITYYFVPQQPVRAPGMIMGKPVDQATIYGAQQPRPSMAFMSWAPSQPQQSPPQQQQQSQQQQTYN